MKYVYRYPAMLLCIIAAVLMVNACSKMDEYKEKYVSNGETTYTGKIDSVRMFSGKNRVKFKALLNPDPRVTGYRVYWGGKADSITFPVTHTEPGGVIEQIIPNIPESEQTFEFVTFDALGNRSISTFKNATSYGSRYQESLINRKIINSALTSNLQTAITLVNMDKATGVFNTEVRYLTTNGDSASCNIPLATTDTFLLNHQYGSLINFRTWYRPDSTSIDNFFTAYTTFQPVSGAAWIDLTSQIVKNYGDPFQRSSWDGSRWGILADWTSSADVKNASGGNGGYELRSGVGMLSMEGGWGLPAVPNGKIYQVVNLPYAGKWRFLATVDALGSAGTKYIAVNAGTTMPDFANITTATWYYNFSTVAAGAKPYIEFTTTSAMDVCIGFVSNMPNTGSYYKVKNVSLSYYKQ
ncbi:DUF4998 domain-containing protein [Paraflavitalea soli]|nr:DUF4998 domain-containing protein [Paraflavitalea soli]